MACLKFVSLVIFLMISAVVCEINDYLQSGRNRAMEGRVRRRYPKGSMAAGNKQLRRRKFPVGPDYNGSLNYYPGERDSRCKFKHFAHYPEWNRS